MRCAGAVTLLMLPACLSFPRADPCRDTGAQCDDPPAVACDGQAVRTYETIGTCDPASGACMYASSLFPCQTFEACIDGVCVCNASSCSCTSKDECAGFDACITADCVNGSCQRAPNSAPCNDNDLCTQTDTCVSGRCEGTNIVCAAVDACHTATCDPATGTCAQVTLLIGSSCDDDNACTDDDICDDDGVCVGTQRQCSSPPPPTCSDAVTVRTYATPGACDIQTGACTYPAMQERCPVKCTAGVCDCVAATCAWANSDGSYRADEAPNVSNVGTGVSVFPR